MAFTNDPGLMRLLKQINLEKGLDFTQYKQPSLARGIRRRLTKHNIESYEEYIRILQSQPEEYGELINALTINVTEFFRNPESFSGIEKIVIPAVIYAKHKHRRKVITAWSCGCSRGDEPYSLALLLLENLEAARKKYNLTVIASDIDDEALKEAKEMAYSRKYLRRLNDKLLKKYFEEAGEGKFIVRPQLRSLVRFRHHNIVADPPFQCCDIILCRNLLIYFNAQLQEKVLLKFYEALNPGGFIVLGMVESIVGAAINIYEQIDSRLRIYRKPEDKALSYDSRNILSQRGIDKVVERIMKE